MKNSFKYFVSNFSVTFPIAFSEHYPSVVTFFSVTMMATTSSIFTCGISYFSSGMAVTNRKLSVHDNNTQSLALKKSVTPYKTPVHLVLFVTNPVTMEAVW